MNIVNERPMIGSIGNYKECGDQVPTKDWSIMLPKGGKTTDVVRPPGSPKRCKQSDVSPSLLRKKIAKTHSLMKGQAEDSKLYKKLVLKLEQYEVALTSQESETLQPKNKGQKMFLDLVKDHAKNNLYEASPSVAGTDQHKDDASVQQVPTQDETEVRPGRNRRAPRRRSLRVSAPRIQELMSEFKPDVFPKEKEAENLIRREIRRNFVFGNLTDSSVEELVGAFEPTDDYKKGEIILQQGEYSDPMYFYVIASGSVDYEVDQETIGTDGPGTSFGEQGLLYSWPRRSTVRARETTSLFRIDQVTFRYIIQNQIKFKTVWRQSVTKVVAMNRMLGLSAEKKMLDAESDEEDADMGAGQDDGEEEVEEMIHRLSQKRQSVQNSLCESRVSMASFSRESMLGEGQFGEVWLVTPNLDELKTQDFALKSQTKKDAFRESIMNNNTTVAEAIERECNVLSQLCHPFIVEFVHKFEDDDNIYLVMGVVKGMELWSVIHRELDNGEWESGISESSSKFYGLLVADTVNYMHRQSICYRDLKPENIMVDHKGYPVIVDFGFAKQIPDGQTFTFCGTPNYASPEIVGNQGHGLAVDWWALGVVIYEMVSGENPFFFDGMSEMDLLEEITTGIPEPLGDEYSADVKDLISKLLIKDPEARLGSSKRGGKDILRHAWFSDLDLLEARKMQLAPPFIPTPDNA